MANLGDRGQMILIAGFALAVTFVALALVVNSAIFTENLASRGEMGGSEDALYLRHEVAAGVGETIRYANVHNTSSQTELRDAVDDGSGNTTRAMERQHATHGAFVNVTRKSGGITYGSRIAQNGSSLPRRQFLSSGGDPTWNVVEDVEADLNGENGTRAFEMNITKSSLATSSSNAFTIDVERYDRSTDDPDSYTVKVYVNTGTPDEVVVEVDKPSGSPVECRQPLPKSYVRIHVTRGLVDGEPCDALRHEVTLGGPSSENFRFAAGVGDHYNVSFENGNNAAGNYSLVTTNTSFSSTNTLNAGGSRDSPYVTSAVYSVELRYWYESHKLDYETDVRVAPEENP